MLQNSCRKVVIHFRLLPAILLLFFNDFCCCWYHQLNHSTTKNGPTDKADLQKILLPPPCCPSWFSNVLWCMLIMEDWLLKEGPPQNIKKIFKKPRSFEGFFFFFWRWSVHCLRSLQQVLLCVCGILDHLQDVSELIKILLKTTKACRILSRFI